MIADFPCLLQQTGWSCLPTAVLTVLEHQGRSEISMDQVADWCRVRPSGACVWVLSLVGLREALQDDFDLDDLERDWDSIREAVEENDEPVIVTIANPNPLAELVGVHAVVIIGITASEADEDRVVYMDPALGRYDSKPFDAFLQWWDNAGQQGFVLRS